MSADKSHLAFSLDSGAVGVIDLSTNVVVKMAEGHESVSSSVC